MNSLGGAPDIAAFSACFTSIKNRIVRSPLLFRLGSRLVGSFLPAAPRLHLHVERNLSKSTELVRFS
jgi:hypothetical protein